MEKQITTGYLAPENLEDNLIQELGSRVLQVHDRLVLAEGEAQPVVWAQNIWFDVQELHIQSVNDAAKQLKAIQRNWALYSTNCHRRAQLISENLPHVSAKPLSFPAKLPTAPLGSWTLIAPDRLLASPRCSSPFPNGEPKFVEDKLEPPSRAYLKLWESFTLLERYPQPGELCLDVGACPGGWTWVLTKLGCEVIAADRSPLEERLMNSPQVSYLEGDAFRILPETHGPFAWVLSDMACYPEKLFDWVSLWLSSKKAKNFICTLKFQGDSHYGIISEFQKIPGSRLVHLSQNKHELTWMRIAKE